MQRSGREADLPLSQEDLALARKAFATFDKDSSGTIDVAELRVALEAMGQHPTEEELFVLVNEADEDQSGEIEFQEFVRVIARHRAASAVRDDEADTIGAFVALGGNPDKTGRVSADKLRAAVREFELTLDVERVLREADADRSGFLDYAEFAAVLK